MLTVIATMKLLKKPDFVGMLQAFNEQTKTEDGCLAYNWYWHDDDENMITVHESYKDLDAWNVHAANLRAKLGPLIGETVEMCDMIAHGDKALLATLKENNDKSDAPLPFKYRPFACGFSK